MFMSTLCSRARNFLFQQQLRRALLLTVRLHRQLRVQARGLQAQDSRPVRKGNARGGFPSARVEKSKDQGRVKKKKEILSKILVLTAVFYERQSSTESDSFRGRSNKEGGTWKCIVCCIIFKHVSVMCTTNDEKVSGRYADAVAR